MESHAKLFGHPLHQMLVVFPLGLLATSAVFDVVALSSGFSRFADVAYWMIVGGVISALAAAIFGIIDWLAIPHNTRAKRVGTLHGVGNIVVVLLFGTSWYLRSDDPLTPSVIALALSFSGVLLLFFTAWLGGELVDRLGVGVDDGASLDAPSSLVYPRARKETS